MILVEVMCFYDRFFDDVAYQQYVRERERETEGEGYHLFISLHIQ